MSKSDFFSFITSLKPIELKAIGELSQVVHLEEGAIVYNRNDPSDALYIINRGALEVMHEANEYAGNTSVSYLSRGDVFGETEVLSNVPRKNAVRVCESASITRFRKKDFPDLIRRVPAFFYYLSQQIASQVTKMTDLAFVQSNCLELSGNLSNFDLVTIYQTILNSAQTGVLSVVGEDKETTATFSFKDGQATHGTYYHLNGEEAFWQLLLHEKLSGTFSFSIAETDDRTHSGPIIRRNPTDLLITALQYRDEFKGLCEEIPDPASIVRRECLNLDWSDPEYANLRPVAESIWQRCYSSTLSLDELCLQVPVCELKFYKTVLQLVRTGHLSVEDHQLSKGVAV